MAKCLADPDELKWVRFTLFLSIENRKTRAKQWVHIEGQVTLSGQTIKVMQRLACPNQCEFSDCMNELEAGGNWHGDCHGVGVNIKPNDCENMSVKLLFFFMWNTKLIK